MEDFEVDGLVLRVTDLGAADKLLTLLTAEKGRITVRGIGATSRKCRYAASAQPFTSSTFLLRKKGNFCYVRDAYFLESFLDVCYDLEKLALATYLCDVANDLALEDVENPELLSLTMNALYVLAHKEVPLPQVKGAYEFVAAVQAGFMPDLSACGHCGGEITEDATLDVMNGRLLCRKCRMLVENDPEYLRDETTAKILIRVSPAVLAALRYLEETPVKRFLSFALDEVELSLFAVVCERYLLNHLEHGFSSLDYYKKLK